MKKVIVVKISEHCGNTSWGFDFIKKVPNHEGKGKHWSSFLTELALPDYKTVLDHITIAKEKLRKDNPNIIYRFI